MTQGQKESILPWINWLRRGDRAAEGARLESVCILTGTGGSNPPLSANKKNKTIKKEQREEERALIEIEKARKKAEKEESYYTKILLKVRKDIESATGYKHNKLMEKIEYLESELKQAQENKNRALSMAQQTRRGYVYIISNIGSFGNDIYKIGMTRRLDPFDRIRELSNASVPFKFDVHAMIFSEDAPTLENKLHATFDTNKVNVINGRKEFFKINLKDIELTVKKYGINAEFIQIPEARDFRETLIRKSTNSEFINDIKIYYPESLI